MQKKNSPHFCRPSFFIAPNLSVLVVIVVLLVVVIVVLVVLVVLIVLLVVVIVLIVVIVHEIHLLISTSIVCLHLGKLYWKTKILKGELYLCF